MVNLQAIEGEGAMEIVLRQARTEDKPRILEISAQIWEGEDYIPGVIDRWLAAEDGEMVVALLGDEVIGFGRWTWLLPGYAWMEGLRVDPTRQNLGAGKAITRGVLDLVTRAGATRVGLATYMTDRPSIHIIESHGFTRVASFVYLEAKSNAVVRRQAEPSDLTTAIPLAEAIEFIRRSAFLAAARGHFPHGWKFYPFALDAETVLSRMRYVFGIRRDGRLSALLCSGHPLRGQGEFTIDFLDGDPTDMAALIRHALHLAHDSATVEAMVPKWGESRAAALDVLKNLGFQAWNAWEEDLFVYEQNLQARREA